MVTRLQAPPYDALAPHLPRPGGDDPATAGAVREILAAVRARGDAAVREYTRRLDGVDLAPAAWEVPAARWRAALARIPAAVRAADPVTWANRRAPPMLLLHGREDKFVPFGHGQWLAANINGVEARLLDHDGHLTLIKNHIGEVHAWLAAHA